MKRKQNNPPTVQLVCRPHCAYFKPDQKEDLACGGFKVLETFLGTYPEEARHFSDLKDLEFTDGYHHLLHHLLCRSCDFFIEGCDFTDPDHGGDARPCGGYVAIDLLLNSPGRNHESLLKTMVPAKAHGLLRSHCVLKHLETKYLYDIRTDDLYEVDEKAFEFLRACGDGRPLQDLRLDKDFLETCFEENLLAVGPGPDVRRQTLRRSPMPSLRYLELQLTNRCNLRCKHCYLGEPEKKDLPLTSALSVLEAFEQMQGLRILFSGGEPLLYPELATLNEALPRFKVRKVLLTNGTLVRESNHGSWCHFDEIQFSLDGLEAGHEKVRGKGTFAQTVRGIEAARKKKMPISVATMVHPFNLEEFEALAEWLRDLDVLEWNIDVPCATGRLSKNEHLLVTPDQGAPYLRYATGGSYHGAEEPFACGYHLCTVTAGGEILKCGFFAERPLGSLKEGLETSWKRAHHVSLNELECVSCDYLQDCKGGCRFRAAGPLGKDPVMCALYGVS